ncbi:MAG: hypothetical protein JO046_01360 [Solirubrobacterales bacterium]|nr:hypothetical protein [Solirubrobacterales bacterium]MBV9680410.1 hypothetical protein [Solirubrobacterales bacterium]
MSDDHRNSSRARVLLIGIPGRAAATTLRPLTGMMGRAAAVGVVVERRAVDRLLESSELERTLNAAVDSLRIQASLERAFQSDSVKRLVDGLFDSGLLDQVFERMFESGLLDRVIDQMFDSGLFDRILERLLASEGLWHMIDEIAASPSVTAAISQQGLGFADQVTDEVRARSRKADDWLERAARRLVHRPPRPLPPDPDPGV